MTLWEIYLQYLSEICEGKRPAPAGIVLGAQSEMERAVELQQQITDIPAFVRACAAAEGRELPPSLYEAFDPAQMLAAMSDLAAAAENSAEAEAEAVEPPPAPKDERHVFDVLLDCVALEEGMTAYLLDILRRKDDLAFFRLAQVATRRDVNPREFLYWLGRKEQYAVEEEQTCARLMDACLKRLLAEGQGELAAALLSGDRTVFETFRCEAPELVHLPLATYEWFETHYLDKNYPIRFFLQAGGVEFPQQLEIN